MNKTINKEPLQILNASAGSGKTYHLVMEYIQLLIADNVHPSDFKHLIAMTFTNKAALEMKERIIEALDGIGTQNKTKLHLTTALSSNLDLDTSEVEKRCNNVLEAILHQYEDFHVMTIDKFNLRLIKSFSRDLDLPGEFEVVLDETDLIESVVDNLLNQLGNPEQNALNDLLIQYAKSNIDEEKTWNFRRNLIEFGSVLKNERHQPGIAKLLELNLSVDLYRKLQAQQKKTDSAFCEFANQLKSIAENIDPKTVHGGGHTINDLSSIYQTEQFPIKEALIGRRLSGNLSKNDGKKDIPDSIKEALKALTIFWEENIQEYVATKLFLKNYFNMALLQYMANALQTTKKEEQLIRISEFNSLISELIQDENAPFIYERLGSRYHHFLLDEFQDTSHLQWLNLVPLVHEAISQNHRNLIVGDPKQSIYRFKNGIAEQFVALPSIYNPNNDSKIAATSSYFESMGHIKTLKDNWRSSPTIVNFNNHFFEAFKKKLPEGTVSFYNAISQNPKSDKKGQVEITSLQGKESHDETVENIINWIESCLKDGYNPSDICILGRRNKECNTWAIALDNAGYRVVSSDSLLIDTSPEVRLTISYLKWRLKPAGENEKKQFAEMYLRQHHKSFNVYKTYIKENTSTTGKRYRYFDDKSFIQDHFGSSEDFFFKYEHLYDLIEGFYRLTSFSELENPYLHHLADLAHEFGLKRGPNLHLFLEEYERKKGSIAVQIPASKDALNIMTIHKSKGLEFPVVLIPSLNVKLDLKSSFLINWNDFILYKRPTKNDILDPLVSLYEYEMAQILTDMVNLCYVGMTRPVEHLYVRNIHDKSTFGSIFHEILKDSGLAEENDGTLLVKLSDGERTPPKEQVFSDSFSPEDITDRLWFPDIALQDKEDLEQKDFLSEDMQFGIAFHLIVSRSEKIEDVQGLIDDALSSGEIRSEHANRIKTLVESVWSNGEYLQLLENAVEILNEQTILLENGEVIRADKIIVKENQTILIDYKTGLPKAKDQKQLMTYRKALEQMNFPNIKAYLFYISKDELNHIG